VCLGLQCIGQAFGGKIVRAPLPMHGKVDQIYHKGEGIFQGLPLPFTATRYHSLAIEPASCPKDLVVTAQTKDGVIMGARHMTLPILGVQFHPESIATEHGHTILKHFLESPHR
jgi:anthranilate synthase component 2